MSGISRLVKGGGCAAGYDPGSPGEEVKGEVVEAEDEDPALSGGEWVLLHSLFYLGCCWAGWRKGREERDGTGRTEGLLLGRVISGRVSRSRRGPG